MKTTSSNRIRDKLALIADTKLGFRPDEVVFVLGSAELFAEMVAAKWLQPIINRHRLQLFDRSDISRAWARVLNGDEPPRRKRKS